MLPLNRIEEQFVLASELKVFEIPFQNEKNNSEKLVGGRWMNAARPT